MSNYQNQKNLEGEYIFCSNPVRLNLAFDFLANNLLEKIEEMNPRLKKTIEVLKNLRKNPPKDLSPEKLEAISFAFDWLLEDSEKQK